jgi:hypothetical protein
MSAQCPLYPQKRTLAEGVGMSALCQKRTLSELFDHLVGELLELPGRDHGSGKRRAFIAVGSSAMRGEL